MPFPRQPPDLPALFAVLAQHGVRYVVTGSSAAMLHGVALQPGDLDITPALDRDNLERLAKALEAIEAKPDPDQPFGDWQRAPDGEWRWVQREPRHGEPEARARWRADPDDRASFDQLLRTCHGALDVVPQISGTYDELVIRAKKLEAFGHEVWVEAIEDLLATFTVPRRDKDVDRVRQLRAIQRSTFRLTAH